MAHTEPTPETRALYTSYDRETLGRLYAAFQADLPTARDNEDRLFILRRMDLCREVAHAKGYELAMTKPT